MILDGQMSFADESPEYAAFVEKRLSDEEIVRCRDCKYRAKACCWCINGGVEPDGFCAWGERRDANATL